MAGSPVVRGVLHNTAHCPPQPADTTTGHRLWAGTTNLVTVVYDLEDAPAAAGSFATGRVWHSPQLPPALTTFFHAEIERPCQPEVTAQHRTGGFGCVPGSHREGYELPIPREPDPVAGYPPLVKRLPSRAGACVVFTETLRHCSLPWVGTTDRRSVFLKFSPREDAYRKGAAERAAQYSELEHGTLSGCAGELSLRVREMLGLGQASKL